MSDSEQSPVLIIKINSTGLICNENCFFNIFNGFIGLVHFVLLDAALAPEASITGEGSCKEQESDRNSSAMFPPQLSCWHILAELTVEN